MRRNRRLTFFLIAAVVLVLTAFVSHARKERGFNLSPAKTMTLIVDSVDYRSDLTRMYGRMIGRPHTSNRIDKIELLSGDSRYVATDIDGVDFTRWFQWEDDGVISIEVDFSSMSPVKSGKLFLTTPHGIEEFTVSHKVR